MKVFVSWSGRRSDEVARALRRWLPNVLPAVTPWVSTEDLDSGTRWNQAMMEELCAAEFGILCVTPENRREPWLAFEAGIIARGAERRNLVCPYLLDLPPEDLGWPLAQFQARPVTQGGTWQLLLTLNKILGDTALPLDELKEAFSRLWPALDAEFLAILPPPERTPSTEQMLTEVLEVVRSLAQKVISSTTGITKKTQNSKAVSTTKRVRKPRV